MNNFLKKLKRKAGLSPGSLVYIGDEALENISISLINFDSEKLLILDDINIYECIKFLEDPSITWMNIAGIHDPKLIHFLGERLNIHTLIQEDIMNSSMRSKLDDFKNVLFLVLRMLTPQNGKLSKIKDEQISFILGKNYVITFMESKQEYFQNVLERLSVANSRIRQNGADYLFYCLVDCVIDYYFVILEHVDYQLEIIEKELFDKPTPNTLRKIQHKKRELTSIRKAIWPLREVISNLFHTGSNLITDSTKTYISDVYDHTIQIIDTLESFREISSGLMDVYMSTMSQKLNEVMKVLTVVSTLFVPLTFIASIYGMNFVNMPILKWEYGFDFSLALMGVVALIMLFYFKRKNWI